MGREQGQVWLIQMDDTPKKHPVFPSGKPFMGILFFVKDMIFLTLLALNWYSPRTQQVKGFREWRCRGL